MSDQWPAESRMPVIKRYPNRKLYNTETKKYISLDEIGDLIRQGGEIQVIDNTSGEDLTAVTLTQIIAEREKRESGFLPHSILAGLIQTGGDRISALQRNLFSSIGFLPQVEEEIRRRIQLLINQGELTVEEGHRILDKMLSLSSPPSPKHQKYEVQIEEIIEKRSIPSREDMDRIIAQLDDLSSKLEKLSGQE